MSTRRLPPERFSDAFPAAIGRPANAALVNRGITTLEQVAELTERELLVLHGVGPKAVRILATALAERNVSFLPSTKANGDRTAAAKTIDAT